MKLTRLPPMVAAIAPRIRFLEDTPASQSRARDQRHTWRAWYKTARWQELRWSVLVRDLFTCQFCGQIEADTSKLVADHRIPHRGNAPLFWDSANLQCLCKACHDSTKQATERRGEGVGRSLGPPRP